MSRRSLCALVCQISLHLAFATLSSVVAPTNCDAAFNFTPLASFTELSNGGPAAGLVMDANGNLFGTTEGAGPHFAGSVFEVAAGSHALTTLATLDGDTGRAPTGKLIVDSNGNLFGTAQRTDLSPTGGTVFKVDGATHQLTKLVQLASPNSTPETGLVFDDDGNLFGTSTSGNKGSIFEVPAGANMATTVVTFNGANGRIPRAGLISDGQGNFFGTTFAGGVGDTVDNRKFGTVFKLSGDTHTLSTLATFDGTGGKSPVGDLVADRSGNLFGVTESGGAHNLGTIFELAAGSETITTLASFDGMNGETPEAGLAIDARGNLFGTATAGGATDDGTVFELPAGASSILALVSFNGANGSYPLGSLTFDARGNLFGTTSGGGPAEQGTVFELCVVAPGDYDGSGVVDLADYDLWKHEFGSTTNLIADGNGNGVIDAADYTIWRDAFTPGAAAASLASRSIPEPSTLLLLIIAALPAGIRRKPNPAILKHNSAIVPGSGTQYI